MTDQSTQPLTEALDQIQADLDRLRADRERDGVRPAPKPGLPAYLRARGNYALADAVQRSKDGLADLGLDQNEEGQANADR